MTTKKVWGLGWTLFAGMLFWACSPDVSTPPVPPPVDPAVLLDNHLTNQGFGVCQGLADGSDTWAIEIEDADGVNDEPGQKDLTQWMLESKTMGLTCVGWQWDETDVWSGANTGDACALYDTDGDGNINYALCVTVDESDPAAGTAGQSDNSPRIYECGDNKPDRCTQPVNQLTLGDFGDQSTMCGVDLLGDDPFNPEGDDSPWDTRAICQLNTADIPGDEVLINVCSYPSEQPNSDPSDCVVSAPVGFVKIVKDAGDDTGTQFDFTLTPGNVNGVTDYSITGSGMTLPITVFAGTFSVSESVPSEWQLDSAVCTLEGGGSTGTPTATGVDDFTVEPSKTTTCTFTNSLMLASIKVIKSADAAGDFDFTGDLGDFTLSTADPDFMDMMTFMDLDPNSTYDIAETLHDDFDFEGVACTLEGGGSTGTADGVGGIDDVAVEAGKQTTCTFTNALKDGSIKVIKNADAAGDFNFTGDLNGFTLSPADPDFMDMMTFENLDATQVYDIVETLNPDFDFVSVACTLEGGGSTGDSDGGSGINDVVVEPGKQTTCTFTNALKSASIKVIKNADAAGDFEFTGDLGDFTLSPADPDFMDMMTFTGLDAGSTYDIAETLHDDFDFEGVACTLEGGGSTGTADGVGGIDDVAVEPGKQTTCTFTNALKDGSIKVIKTASAAGDFDFSGDLGDFTLSPADPDFMDMMTFDDLDPTQTYSVDETVPDLWDLTSASCTLMDGTATGTESGDGVTGIEVEPGKTTTCTFVNAPETPPGITVTKTANTMYTRTWIWDIDKRVLNAPDAPLAPGEVYILQYQVEPTATSMDSEHKVSGQITVTNDGEAGSPFVATITDVSDVLSANGTDISATITSCSPMLPAMLAAGESVVCDYESTDAGLADHGMWQNKATASGTWNDGSDAMGMGTADATFGDPTSEIDECVNVQDLDYPGEIPDGMVCADELPTTFDFDLQLNGDGADVILDCGENIISNTSKFTTNDTGTMGDDGVEVPVRVSCGEGCTLTQGYWKTHSDQGPAPYDPEGWGNLGDYDGDGVEEEEEESLIGTDGYEFYDVFWTPVRGRPWYSLAHQYMAAVLNVQNGADPTDAMAALTAAKTWIESYDPELRMRDLTREERAEVTGLISTLTDYNEGLIGPGHCAEDFTSDP